MVRAVIDTNELLEGLTRPGPAADIVDAWIARRFVPCVSTTVALEYEDVLTRKLGPARRAAAMRALPALLARAEYTPVVWRVRPFSTDPGDDMLIECAWAAGADIVTSNLREVRGVEAAFGVGVLAPARFLSRLEATP